MVKLLVSLTGQVGLHVRTDYPRTVVCTIVLNRRLFKVRMVDTPKLVTMMMGWLYRVEH